MSGTSAEDLVRQAQDWWSTEIIDIHPGQIFVRGYAIEDLIGAISFPEMIWLMLRGELPSREQGRLFEAALVAAVDHGPQAPSIAVSRMAATCGLHVNGAMASAINVLDDVHGGAGQQAMELYLDIKRELERSGAEDSGQGPADLAQCTRRVLARWKDQGTAYVPGFGHRFHPVDPRAPRLLSLVDEAAAGGVVEGRFARIGRSVSEELAAGRRSEIPMNIDGATAVVYCELGFDPPLGRGIFILSRSVGILAHAWEQMRQGGRIKGPMPPTVPYRYVGQPPRAVPGRA